MEDEELKMIPTGYRTKIPRALSFACGAKMLSLAWQNVPQFEEFDLFFCCDISRALFKTSGWRNILGIHYSQWRPAQIPRFREEREGGRKMWNISVDVCRREDAYEVRQWLQIIGLEQARLWLEHKAHSQGELCWNAFFNEETSEFHIEHKK